MNKVLRFKGSLFPTPAAWKSLAFTALSAGAVLWYYRSKKQQQIQKGIYLASSPQEFDTGAVRIGGPIELIDHNGNPLSTTGNLANCAMMIYFGFTNCPDVCPEELEKISKIMQRLQRNHPKKYKHLKALFVTCDPERDTPAELRGYLQDFHPDIIGLTGSLDAVKQVAKKYRVYFSKNQTSPTDYLVDHSTVIYLMDRNGNFVKHFGKTTTVEECVESILKLI